MTARRLKQLDMFPEPTVVHDQPMSVCTLVTELGGSAVSGQQRYETTQDVHEALHSFCLYAIARHTEHLPDDDEGPGWELAARDALAFVARLDPSWRPKMWLDMDAHYPGANEWGVYRGDWLFLLLMDEHKQALLEHAARDGGHGRDDEIGEGDDT